MSFVLIAHRSGPGVYPEQTIVSARYSLSLGADMAEMDVQYTRDGIPVICHDPNTLRMFGVDCMVRDMLYSEFMTLRHASDPAYPSHSLDDIIRSGVSPVLFHCKFTGEQLKDLASRLDAAKAGRWVIGVQRPEDVDSVKENSSGIDVLSFMESESLLQQFLEGDADYIRLWEEWVTQAKIDDIHSHGKKVWIMAGSRTPEGVGYTSAENLLMWRRMGADGVLVNDVAWAEKVLEEA